MCSIINCLFLFIFLTKISESYCEPPSFSLEYQWKLINFTWSDEETYKNAISSKTYIPENVAMAGIKLYKDKIYTATPRIRAGVPATLGYISNKECNNTKIDPLITPFPNWDLNKLGDCSAIQSVQSMEIDKNGIMWVIDGFRINDITKDCPAKIILIDLNQDNKIIKTYIFPQEITLTHGGFLNDIVIDNEYAYITDHSSTDPGLVVYSKESNKSWKFRDSSMFPDLNASGFVVNNLTFNNLAPVDGIALSPILKSPGNEGQKRVYYCALTGFNIYSLSTDILRDENISKNGNWRRNVQLEGKKQSQSDGMVVDCEGNLYYTLLPLYGVGVWNVNEPFTTARIVEENPETMIWTDSFGFDNDQNDLYLLTNNINRFFDPTVHLEISEEIKFRIFKLHTGTKSYLY